MNLQEPCLQTKKQFLSNCEKDVSDFFSVFSLGDKYVFSFCWASGSLSLVETYWKTCVDKDT